MPNNLRKPNHEPQWDETESDLGEPNGRWQTEHAKRAKYAVAVQSVSAIGRRPKDWIKRDLLAGSSGDDRRNWFVRKVLKNKPSFLVQDRDRILPGQLTTVQEARAFDYMSRHQLFGLVESLSQDSAEWKAAAAAAVCPTSLYQTRNLIPCEFGFVRKNQVCRNKTVCPHCYARSMTDQFDVASQSVKDDPPEFIALFSRSCPVDLNHGDQFNEHRRCMRQELIDLAKSAGGVGGIWSQQVGPELRSDSRLFGDELRFSEREVLELRVAVVAVIPTTRQSLKRLNEFPSRRKLVENLTEIDVQRFDAKRSLRSFFLRGRDLGTSPNKLQENSHGLFYWPPASICSPDQWVSRYYLMCNQPAARRWGSWSKQNSNKDSIDQTAEKSTTPTQQQRRRTLLRSAKPILTGLGFPQNTLPGRVKLRELLSEAGIVASVRDVRWLLEHLS
ncbi:hypothetical protein [Rosistilla oblonga]|uniref:hypothetical protein n=1 Tax=Rosistilla oblonga TaxID=2527990 RepID=UPI003A9761E9